MAKNPQPAAEVIEVDGRTVVHVHDQDVEIVRASPASPFPEIAPEQLDAIATRAGVDRLVVVGVVQALLQEPKALVALTGRFGEVRTQHARRGHVRVDHDDQPIDETHDPQETP